jgi:uncharacterized membrane protein YdbT with pleckstrin-like domain
MPENIKRYHPVGNRTLFMLIFKRSLVFFILIPVLFFVLFGLWYVPSEYVRYAADGVMIYFVGMLLLLAFLVGIGWLEYYRYWIFVDDKDLKIARGLIATEQIGIPYRRIQDIKIRRSLLDQVFGVSDIVIKILGVDNDADNQKEDEIILPSLEKQIAAEIQDIILKRAQVEQISVLGQKFGPL